MTDSDALTLKRLLNLYGPLPLLTLISQVVRSYADQAGGGTWGHQRYRLTAAMRAYHRPSKELEKGRNTTARLKDKSTLQPWTQRS